MNATGQAKGGPRGAAAKGAASLAGRPGPHGVRGDSGLRAAPGVGQTPSGLISNLFVGRFCFIVLMSV